MRRRILCFQEEEAHVPHHREGFPAHGSVCKTCEALVRFAYALDAKLVDGMRRRHRESSGCPHKENVAIFHQQVPSGHDAFDGLGGILSGGNRLRWYSTFLLQRELDPRLYAPAYWRRLSITK
jgi:hypothetical protein